MVTHDMAEAMLLADRIAVLRAGRLVRVGTPGELMCEPGDEYVERLISTPKRQMEQLEALASGRSPSRAVRGPVGGSIMTLLAAALDNAWAQLPAYLGGHVTLTVVALALGIAISVPLGVGLTRSRRLRGPVLARWRG